MNKVSLPRLLVVTGVAVFALSALGFVYVAATSGRDLALVETTKRVVASSMAISLFTVVLAAAVGAWVGVLANMLKMARSRKPGVAAFDHRLLFNPFNALFLPRYLTAEGLAARKRLLIYLLVFVLSIGAGFGVKWLVTVAT